MAIGTAVAVGTIGATIHAKDSGANMNPLDFDIIGHSSISELRENAVEYVGRFKCDLDHDQAPNFVECDIYDALELVGITGLHPYVDARLKNNFDYFAYLNYYYDNGSGKRVFYSQLNRIDGEPGEDIPKFEDLDGFPKDSNIPNKVPTDAENDFVKVTLYFEKSYAEEEFAQLEEILRSEFPEIFQSVDSVLYGVYFDKGQNQLVENFVVTYEGTDGEYYISEFKKYTEDFGLTSEEYFWEGPQNIELSDSTWVFETILPLIK